MRSAVATGPTPGASSTIERPRRGESLVGTRRLVRLVIRRDRIRLALWVVGLVALMAVSAQSIAGLYDTPATVRTYTDTVGDNPALIMFAGPGYGFDDPNAGVILVNETALWMALGCALMSVFLVNRHTRAEEESERADLVRSTVVGRHAPLAATLAVAMFANVAVAVGSALTTLALGFPVAGTLALSAAVALAGVAFAGSTAVAVQIGGTGRSALGLGSALVGVAFVVRGIGDVSAPALAWTTPFGWSIGIRSYAGERWWALLGLAAFATTFVLIAIALSARRDLGSGLLTQRSGPSHAPAWTLHPLGLALRLQRGAVIGWAAGLTVAGLVYGSVADDVGDMLRDNPELADYLTRISGATLEESYLSTVIRLLALVTSGFAISSALRNRSEESAGYAESVLATAVSRWWWAGSHLVVTVIGTVVLAAASGVATGITYSVAIGDGTQVGTLTVATLVTVPPVLVMVGLATAVFGWLPHGTTAAWGALAIVAVIEIFGAVLRLPRWLIRISPFEHVPALPAESWDTLPLVVLTLIAAALTAIGLIGFRRRDLAAA